MPADKNPSPRANEDFRRVTDAFDILGDPASRKRYDAGVRWEEQRRRGSREQEKRREKMRRQKKEREEKERLRAHSEMMRRARATQGRMVKISSFGEFEKEMLDPSGRVYTTHALIMFVGNRGAERKGEETMYFPYPFAGETNGNVNSRHAGIKVARVRFNAQTELTRHFRARSGSGGEPHIVFARRGDPVGTFHVFQPWREAGAADVHGKLKQWVESMLVIRVTIVNRHSLPVELMVLRNGRIVHGRQSLPSTYEIAFSLQAGDRVVAFDARVDAYHPGVARTDARIPLFPGVLLLDAVLGDSPGDNDAFYAIPNGRCYDLSTQCHGWTRGKDQCLVNPEFMHHVCPFTCDVCGDHVASDVFYVAFHKPIHQFPRFLRGGVRYWRSFAEDVGSILRQQTTAVAAFFVAGLLLAFNIALFGSLATSPPRSKKGGKGSKADLVSVLEDAAPLLLALYTCACVKWMTSTPARDVPSWLGGFHGDLVGVASQPDIFLSLLVVGAIACVYVGALLDSVVGGRMDADVAFAYAATLMALVSAGLYAMSLMLSWNVTQPLRWEHLWSHRKNAGCAVLVVGASIGAGLASLKRLSSPLCKSSAFPAIALNLMIALAAYGFATADPHFKTDMMHVMELRKNVAFAFTVVGMLVGKVVLSGKT